MTENQLIRTDVEFAVNYTPAQIKIENEEQLQALIEQVADFYGKQVFTDENIPEAKKARADLNKMINQMEDKRKEIKRGISKPITDFEKIIKGYVDSLGSVVGDIAEGIKSFEDAEKAVRLKKIQAEVASIAALFNIEPEAIEISTTWLTKAAFNTKGEVKGKTSDEIKDKLKIVAMERDRIASDKAMITDYAEIAGLDPYAWASMIDQGWSVADVREKIKQSVEDKRMREAEAERLRQAKAEHDAALAQLEESQMENGTVINIETGEIVSQENTAQVENTNENMTVVLELTGSYEQLNNLNNYLIKNNIKVAKVG